MVLHWISIGLEFCQPFENWISFQDSRQKSVLVPLLHFSGVWLSQGALRSQESPEKKLLFPQDFLARWYRKSDPFFAWLLPFKKKVTLCFFKKKQVEKCRNAVFKVLNSKVKPNFWSTLEVVKVTSLHKIMNAFSKKQPFLCMNFWLEGLLKIFCDFYPIKLLCFNR